MPRQQEGPQPQQQGGSRNLLWFFMICTAVLLCQVLFPSNLEYSGNRTTGEFKFAITHPPKNSIVNHIKEYADHSQHHATTHHTTESRTNVGIMNYVTELLSDQGQAIRTMAGVGSGRQGLHRQTQKPRGKQGHRLGGQQEQGQAFGAKPGQGYFGRDRSMQEQEWRRAGQRCTGLVVGVLKRKL